MNSRPFAIAALVVATAVGLATPALAVDTSGEAIRRAVTNVQGDDSAQCRYVEPRGDLYGYEHVEGTAERKRALGNAGATSRHIAIAMLENRNLSTDYTDNDTKTGDAANFGRFKQNWGMIRRAVPEYRGLGPGDYQTGRALNRDLSWDVRVLRMSIEHQGGIDPWMAGHRCGAAGLANANLKAVKQYSGAVDILTEKVAASDREYPSTHYNNLKYSDLRFWINVPAV